MAHRQCLVRRARRQRQWASLLPGCRCWTGPRIASDHGAGGQQQVQTGLLQPDLFRIHLQQFVPLLVNDNSEHERVMGLAGIWHSFL